MGSKTRRILIYSKKIIDKFNASNTNHIYFKESTLCFLFDDSNIRTREDIDVYIDSSNLDKARKLLVDAGYEFKPVDTMHNEDYYKNGILIELHFNIFDEEVDKRWQKYFAKPFDLSENVASSLYKLNDNAHFLYCLAHLLSTY